MRISTNSVFDPYERALAKTQTQKVKEQIRLTTGFDLIELADDPKRLVSAKNLTNTIDRNSTVKNGIETALKEFAVVDEQLRAISDKMQLIRENAIDSTLTGNTGNLHALGIYVKGILDDLVKDANLDFNGHFTFAGTKTTPDSMNDIGSPESPFPFELIKGDPTEDNSSGLQVVFKGNNKERSINKDKIHTETMNVTANNMFGGDGTEIFGTIIDLYNLMAFNSDGTGRAFTDVYNTEDVKKLDVYQKKIADQILKINTESAIIGAKYKNLDNLRLQMDNEELLLKDFLSEAQDTNVAKSTLNLKKAENALQYTLQVGATLLRQSLFDFIA